MSKDPELDLSEWMATWTLHPRDEAVLSSKQQALVDMAASSNRACRAIVYAFLDCAWGHHDWRARGVSMGTLRDVRARDLKNATITEPWHIDVLYGAFFGTGEPAYLRPIVTLLSNGGPTLTMEQRIDLLMAAEWSLGSLTKQYPHIDAAVATLTGGEAH